MEKLAPVISEGHYLVEHGKVLSFLNTSSFPILHTELHQFQEEHLRYLERARIIDRKTRQNGRNIVRLDHPAILHSLVVLTNRCDMNCGYCYTESNEHSDEEEIDGERWKQIFDNIKIPGTDRIQNVSLTGGEPTCHPDFLDIFKHMSGKYKVEVSTNGSKLSDAHLEAFKNFDGLICINISIDSRYPKEDEVMRGENTYERRIINLNRLCERDIPTCVGMVVHHLTVKSLADTTRFFLDNFSGLKIKYLPLSRTGRAVTLDNSLFLSEADVETYLQSASEMVRQYGERVVTDPTSCEDKEKPVDFHWSGRCSHMKYGSEKGMHRIKTVGELLVDPEKCNAAYGVVSISPAGRLRPCLRADSFFGEILNRNTKNIIMPSLSGISFEEIGRLPFWGYVQKGSSGFNPLATCALKYGLGDKNGSE
jgi:MoaA/NifB/PqqE/SkfB family radical SAM enzyme